MKASIAERPLHAPVRERDGARALVEVGVPEPVHLGHLEVALLARLEGLDLAALALATTLLDHPLLAHVTRDRGGARHLA